MRLSLLTSLASLFAVATADDAKPWVVLYVEDWAIWQRNYGMGTVEKYLLARDLPVANIALNFAFLQLNPKTCEVIPGDGEAEFVRPDPQKVAPEADFNVHSPDGSESGTISGVFGAMATLRARYPYIKLIPSIGGWSLSHTYHDCLTNKMDYVVDHVVEMVRVWGLDGVDFDWEYPECVGGCGCQKEATCPDTSNVAGVGDWELYKQFTKKIRTKFDTLEKTLNRHLMITGAFGMNPNLIDGGNDKWGNPTPWDWLCSEDVFDLMNLMAYDFYGPWQAQTGPLAPLYSDSDGPANMMSIDDSLTRILKKCKNPKKLLMGLATYGKTWANVPKVGTPVGLYQNSTATKIPAGGTWEAGTVSYWDLKNVILPKCTTAYHKKTESNTAFCEGTFPANITGIGPRDSVDTFITYEDPVSWKAKMSYAKSKGLAGAIIWAASDMGDGDIMGDHHAELFEGLLSGWTGKDVKLNEPKNFSGSWPKLAKWPWYPCPIGFDYTRSQESAPYSCPSDLSTLPTFSTPTPVDPIETGKNCPAPNKCTGDTPTTGPNGDSTTPGGDDRWWTATSGSTGEFLTAFILFTSCLVLFFV